MKRAVVIGASSKLGGKITEKLADKGFFVYASSRDPKRIKETANTKALKLDVTDERTIKKAFNKISIDGGLDACIYVAGVTLSGPALEVKAKDYQNVLDINTVGALRVVQEVVPLMDEGGSIVFITSLAAISAFPNYSVYSSSKFALDALSRSLRYELNRQGISVTNVAPGAIADSGKGSTKHRSAREKVPLLKIIMPMATSDEVTETVVKAVEKRLPARIAVGADSKMVYFAQKLLPSRVWDFIQQFVWNKK